MRPWAGAIDQFCRDYALPPDPLELPSNAYLDALNRVSQARQLLNTQGMPIRFCSANLHSELPYERTIFESGVVPTRCTETGFSEINMWHDYFNALMWLQWPLAKSAINAQQYSQQQPLTSAGLPQTKAVSERGVTRDRLTLLDESGVVVLASTFMAELFRQRLWRELFLVNRIKILQGEFRVFVFGHGLMQRLQTPFKSITAHAWVFPLKEGSGSFVDALVDPLMANTVESLPKPQPLPVMGLPDWPLSWSGQAQDEAFYNDLSVFRP
jgi:Protein of unknown function (DUF3025)